MVIYKTLLWCGNDRISKHCFGCWLHTRRFLDISQFWKHGRPQTYRQFQLTFNFKILRMHTLDELTRPRDRPPAISIGHYKGSHIVAIILLLCLWHSFLLLIIVRHGFMFTVLLVTMKVCNNELVMLPGVHAFTGCRAWECDITPQCILGNMPYRSQQIWFAITRLVNPGYQLGALMYNVLSHVIHYYR